MSLVCLLCVDVIAIISSTSDQIQCLGGSSSTNLVEMRNGDLLKCDDTTFNHDHIFSVNKCRVFNSLFPLFFFLKNSLHVIFVSNLKSI